MMFKFIKISASREGATALLLVIIISTAALIMAVGASQLGLGELEISATVKQGNASFFLADSCLEETLRQLKINPAFSGGTLPLTEGLCIIEITAVFPNYSVVVTGVKGEYRKKIRADLTFNGQRWLINNWSELSF